MARLEVELRAHVRRVRACGACAEMQRPVITGDPIASPVMLIGQAPGRYEGELGRPFAWTAGRTMFGWFGRIGLDEEAFRARVYMVAVCRCFPGANPKGGDRLPSRAEIANCAPWLKAEMRLLRPALVLPIGKLAISRLMPVQKLTEVIGKQQRLQIDGLSTDVIPLPHPSGASPWHRIEPGKTLLASALRRIHKHPAWRTACGE